MSENRSTSEINRRGLLALGWKGLAFVAVNSYVQVKTGHNPAVELGQAFVRGFLDDDKPKLTPAILPQPEQNIPEIVTKISSDHWKLNPDYKQVINALNIEQHKKYFVNFSIEATNKVLNDGYKINPRVMVAQAALESSYGTDTLSPVYNYFGMKAGKGDSSVKVATHEDYGNGRVVISDNFIAYENPYQVFYDYAHKMTTRSFYADAVACRQDDRLYLEGLIHVLDPESCQIVQRQGEPGVLSYATDRKYVDVALNIIDFLNLDQVYSNN